jgi:hypothetical protein
MLFHNCLLRFIISKSDELVIMTLVGPFAQSVGRMMQRRMPSLKDAHEPLKERG